MDDAATPPFWQLIRRGSFARLWWAGAISSLGDWVAFFATLALANRIGGTTGILVPLVARILPGLVAGPLFGVLADRWDRRKTMVVADATRAVLVLGLVFVNSLTSLFAISMLLELMMLMWAPAKEATVPNLVPPRRIVTANSLSLGAAYGTFPIGSALFALLAKMGSTVEQLGIPFLSQISFAFVVDSLTFLASALLLWRTAIPSVEADERQQAKPGFNFRQTIADLVEGARFVAGNRRIRSVVVGMVTALFGGGMVIALGVPFAEDVLKADSAGFGLLVTVLGTGAGLGMLTMSAFGGHLWRRDVLFGVSLVVAGAALTVASLTGTVGGAVWWMFFLGVGSGSAYVTGFSHLHEQVEDRLRGRTFAALLTLVRSGMLAAIAVAGISAAALTGLLPPPFQSGTRTMLFFGGLVIVAAGAGTLWSVREVFGRPKLTAEAWESVESGTQAFTFRGDRRPPEDRR